VKINIPTVIGWLSVLTSVVLVSAQQASPPVPDQGPPSTASTASHDGGYLLHAGDELMIKAFQHPDLDEVVRIRPDGRLSLQLVSDIAAAGMTPTELSRALDGAYEEFFKEPKISVIVRTFAAEQIFVGGEVLQPGVQPLVGDMTILGAVMRAGGFRPTARSNGILLLRNDGHGGKGVELVDVKRLLSKGGPDMMLQPFDVVFVPQSKIAKVDQFVDQYVRQVIPASLTGGFTYLFGSTAVLAAK
jgi:protein involved in polysaccharide export with SLBB domain